MDWELVYYGLILIAGSAAGRLVGGGIGLALDLRRLPEHGRRYVLAHVGPELLALAAVFAGAALLASSSVFDDVASNPKTAMLLFLGPFIFFLSPFISVLTDSGRTGRAAANDNGVETRPHHRRERRPETPHECCARIIDHPSYGTILTVPLPAFHEALVHTGSDTLEDEVAAHPARILAIDLHAYRDGIDPLFLETLLHGASVMRVRNLDGHVTILADGDLRRRLEPVVGPLEEYFQGVVPDLNTFLAAIEPLDARDPSHACTSELVELAGFGRVICLVPVAESQSEAAEWLKGNVLREVVAHEPRGLAFDLRAYRGEIGDVLLAGMIEGWTALCGFDRSGQARIVATGRTGSELDSLLRLTQIETIFGLTRPDLESAFAQNLPTTPDPADE